MKVPYKWLMEYVDLEGEAVRSIVEVADALTLSGSKVEEVIERGKDIDRVVTGKVLEIVKHPDADSLVVCQLDIGSENIQIVTGAKNLTVSDIVPVALNGSSLPGGVKIKKGKLRGIESNGMMCSVDELGIGGDERAEGILILPKNTPLGADIREIVGLTGGIIDFEITSNRSDCFGIYGIARETAATYGAKLKPLEMSYRDGVGDVNEHLSVAIHDGLCRRYAAKMVKNVTIKESPAWLQEKLFDAGVRPINNIVDITNFIMIELGQPMHAFDYRDISGCQIVVERARDGESFVTLDSTERKLDSSMLMIRDGAKSVAIAGVMGGENSEIKTDTTTVVFELANFNGPNIRLTSKKLNLRTDASGKYEKDLDPELISVAMARTCNLIEQLGVGELVGGLVDIYPNKPETVALTVSSAWISKFLGVEIPRTEIVRILNSLYIEVKNAAQDCDELELVVPSFRQDIRIREDVAEEVCRIYGYDRIPPVKIKGEAVEAARTPLQRLRGKVKESMVSSGLYEAVTYSFFSPKAYDSIKLPKDDIRRKSVTVLNPLGEDFSVMRTTMIPSMMDCLGRNYARDNKNAGLFEVANVYIPGDDVLPDERETLILGFYGDGDFYTLKGIVENLLKDLGVDKVEYAPETEHPVFHPGRTAKLLVRRKPAGCFGEVHPGVAEQYGIDAKVYLAELDLGLLYEAAKTDKKYKSLPKYPAVARDIAMLIEDTVTVGDIEKVILKSGGELLSEIALFDVYKGKQVPEGLKSVAYSLLYRHEGKTLTDVEVNKVHDNIVKQLKDKLNAQLR